MGCVLALLSSTFSQGLASCCTGTAVACCCRGCCKCRNSTSTRIVFACVLLSGMILSAVMIIPEVQEQLGHIHHLCGQRGSKQGDCVHSVSAIYRCFFAIAMFFGAFSLIMIDVRSSKDCRAGIQNGFWFFKFTALICIMVGAFYMPAEFAIYWMYICFVGSAIYIIIQLILTIDFAYFLNEYLGDNYEVTENKCFVCLLCFITMACYGLSIALTTCLYIYYTKSDGCVLNKVIISVNGFACMTFSVLSILKRVQEKTSRAGLLQSSIMTLYVMFITWTGLSNQPDINCNPGIFNIFKYGADKDRYESKNDNYLYLRPVSILALLLSSLCILYSAMRNSSNSTKLFGSNNNNNADRNDGNNENETRPKKDIGYAYDDETEETRYSYSFFHFIMFISSMYTTMCFTNWMNPTRTASQATLANSSAFWFKVVSSWMCALLYTWTLVAPLLFPGRDFS